MINHTTHTHTHLRDRSSKAIALVCDRSSRRTPTVSRTGWRTSRRGTTRTRPTRPLRRSRPSSPSGSTRGSPARRGARRRPTPRRRSRPCSHSATSRRLTASSKAGDRTTPTRPAAAEPRGATTPRSPHAAEHRADPPAKRRRALVSTPPSAETSARRVRPRRRRCRLAGALLSPCSSLRSTAPRPAAA